MTTKPFGGSKEAAVELANRIYSDEFDPDTSSALLARILQANAEKSSDADVVPDKPAFSAHSVGIWQSSFKDGAPIYKRNISRRAEWAQWADIPELKPKGVKRRVLLLGESVARGYFYDPHYTVAGELESILNCNKKWTGIEFEVVDLARSNIGMTELLEVLRDSTALSADAVVIFAGNNWGVPLSAEEIKMAHRFFKDGAFDGLKQFIEDKYKRLTAAFLNDIRDSYVAKGIPAVFVIPEFNLCDWKSDEVEKIFRWLPDDKVSAWIEARDVAYCALANNEMELLKVKAEAMVDLDPSNPLGFELLARYMIKSGKGEEARRCLEAARDTSIIGRCKSSKPRCVKFIRDAMLAEANNYGVGVVDLSAVFREVFGDKLPDRELFLDYCHLTVKGIKAAMKYTSQRVIEAVTGKKVRVADIIESKIMPDREAQAIAHFAAAIHNAHYGQPKDIIEFQCSRAAYLSATIADTMLQFADFATRHTSTILCKSFEELISAGRMRVYEGGFVLRHRRNGKLMDIPLVDSIIKSLESIGIRHGPDIRRLRVQEHGIGEKAVNLLQSFYAKSSYNAFNLSYEPNYLEARTDKTTIRFIAAGGKPILIELTYRTPNGSATDKNVKIVVNGQTGGLPELKMTKEWTTAAFTIGRKSILNGVNELVIIWPYVFEPLASLKPNVEDSFFNSIFPVLGQINSLTATAQQ
ncbi:MAG TPA: hypothetical protein VFE32_20695 [Puia sp.]|jgi:hypothetical protein|nr:hypothetical protein [Puia sp.]